MPPKRARRASPTASGLPAGERLKRAKLAGNDYSAWGWVGTDVTNASEISQEHCLATCGFSRHSPHPFCPNKYVPKTNTELIEPIPKEAAAEGELEDDIIVISDDDSPTCSARACKSNPNCLNYLGQDKWENEDKAHDAFMKLANLGENPLLLAREPGNPIGLKNLGATCYANAFLQVWFQDLPFRSGVYRCQPPAHEERKFEESPIFQLQVTFAAMQESTQSAFSPVKLVESLKLRTTEQQDAQEFSKLFMAHLDSEFQKQEVQGLKSLLADQFQGKQVYGTVCSKCNTRSERDSEFLEIEVNIPSNAKLEDRLAALLQPEELSGDNKYLCSVCDSLQDAKRYSTFKELPPVLHISLLRFVFDISTMERKKSKHSISFPMTLDMDQFIGSAEMRNGATQNGGSPSSKNLYQLRGILLHKGPSAYHGHYEAQVFDIRNQKWYQFNDETVTEIESPAPKPKAAAMEATNGKLATSKPKGPRGRPRKRARVEDSDVEIIDGPPSPKAKEESPLDESHISSKDAYMLIYARAPASATGDGEDSSSSITNGHLQNGYNTSGPIPPERGLQVVNQLNAEYDRSCEEYTAKANRAKELFETKRQLVMDIYRSWSLSSSSNEEESCVVSRQALEAWLTHRIAKPKDQSKDSSSKATTPSEIASDDPQIFSSSNIVCTHGKLDPTKAASMKRVRKVSCQRIVTEDHSQFDQILEPTDVCRVCVENVFLERLYQIQHPQLVAQFDGVCYLEDDATGYWISKTWLKDWRLAKPKMHTASEPDPPPDAPEYDSHVKCEHGSLSTNITSRRRISIKAYDLLKELFPNWVALSTDTEPCAVCEALMHLSKQDKREIRRQAEDEKARLKHMHDNALSKSIALLENTPCALISTQFIRAWRQWLFRPSELPRPDGVDNSQFICKHGLLSLDPNIASDLDSSITVIRRSDWDVLEDLYSSGPLIAIENDGTRWVHDLPVCEECRRERKSTFDTTELTIRILRPSDPLPTKTTYAEEESRKELPRSQPSLLTYGSRKIGGIRQSKRLLQAKDHVNKKKIIITRTMTVKDLKITICDVLGIPTIYQRLFHQGHELEDNAASITSLGILTNDTLDLREESEDVDLLDSDDDEARKNSAGEGQGFGGTLLGGGERDPVAREPSSSGPDTPTDSQKSCPACTFENPIDALACTMCDTVFDVYS